MEENHGKPQEPTPVVIAEMQGESGSTAVNTQPSRNTKMNRRKHVDYFISLNPERVTEESRQDRRLLSLQEIASGLIWLHAVGLNILSENPITMETPDYMIAEGQRIVHDKFASYVPKDVICYSERSDLFSPRMKDRISEDVRRKCQKKTTRKEVFQVLTDNSTDIHYERIMIALEGKNMDLDSEREQLSTFLHIVEELQKSIRLAAQESYLSKNILNTLRKKMDSLDAQYGRCQAKLNGSGKAKKYLVNLKSKSWWESEEDPDLDEDDKPAKTISKAYEGTSASARSSLNFIVPLALLISAVPAGFAFYAGRVERGSIHDSDFSQAITSCISQVLSVATLIWPTLHHHRLSGLAWFWVWVGASGSVIFATMSIPVYLFLSVRWSFGIGFAGAVTQAIVQLQFINAI